MEKTFLFYSCIKLCLVHDMAESIVGDYTPHDNISKEQKYREETVLSSVYRYL